MAEEEKTEGSEEQPAEEALAEDAAAEAEEPVTGDPATTGDEEASEADAPEQTPPAEGEAPAGEEEASAAEQEAPAAERESPAEGTGAAGEPAEAGAKTDLPPGADLDPIALEPEGELSAEERARLEAEAEERARREAALTGDGEPEPAAAARAPAQMASDAVYLATGKRKSSIARVSLTPGEGKIEVNRRTLEEYFPRPLHQSMARQPLAATGYEGTVDVRVRVHGGGVSGQAGAVRHGIARALTEIDPELRLDLKRRGFLTRDARVKERRKAGLKKARKRPQFSKR
jgi:small subunit ribosomal protein S9